MRFAHWAGSMLGEATSVLTIKVSWGGVSTVRPSKRKENLGVTSGFPSTQAVFPRSLSPRHRAAALPRVSPSGRRWVRIRNRLLSRSTRAVSFRVSFILLHPQ